MGVKFKYYYWTYEGYKEHNSIFEANFTRGYGLSKTANAFSVLSATNIIKKQMNIILPVVISFQQISKTEYLQLKAEMHLQKEKEKEND